VKEKNEQDGRNFGVARIVTAFEKSDAIEKDEESL
jgi:hypothetical protein